MHNNTTEVESNNFPAADYENPICSQIESGAAFMGNPSFEFGSTVPVKRSSYLKKLKPLPAKVSCFSDEDLRAKANCAQKSVQRDLLLGSNEYNRLQICGRLNSPRSSPKHSTDFFVQKDSVFYGNSNKLKDPVSILRPGSRSCEWGREHEAEDSKNDDANLADGKGSLTKAHNSSACVAVSVTSPLATPREPGKFVTRSKWTHSVQIGGQFIKTRTSSQISGFPRSWRQLQLGEDRVRAGVLLEEGGELPTRTLERLGSLQTVSIKPPIRFDV